MFSGQAGGHPRTKGKIVDKAETLLWMASWKGFSECCLDVGDSAAANMGLTFLISETDPGVKDRKADDSAMVEEGLFQGHRRQGGPP